NVLLGCTSSGAPIWLDKTYVEADKRIVLGFIEPHFFAGFSGGAKGVAPGVAGIESILYLHGYDLIAHPNSTWGVMDGNPMRQAVQELAAACPPDFLINVTLNNAKRITNFFVGDYVAAHAAGCACAREQAMTPVPHRFPIVVTSNSGFPLDQNLYQTVKGMSAAARIVEEGGMIIVAAECSDGIPSHGHFGSMLRQAHDTGALEQTVRSLPTPRLDQWQVQVFASILKRCEVALYSKLDAETTRACLMTPVDDVFEAVAERIEQIGRGAPVAVLPEGPLTVAYVARSAG
ncbi:MAG: nickel-dependent lactate racemase, partial [Candidatus Hydrogenedentes bacterium]|nr:nickel-dependent lactate racemase [Candidatus Hydrogenedentota bacterium]